MKKKIILGIMAISFILVLTSFSSAVIWLCLKDGESVPISSQTDRYVCNLHSGSGFCKICANESYWYASWNKCEGLQGDAAQCHSLNENSSAINLTLKVNSPLNGIFTKIMQNIDVKTNKISKIELFDSFDNSTFLICPNCKEYNRTKIFKDGFHNITIRARYQLQIKEYKASLFIDSKKPVISKTLPLQNKFASNEFSVSYDETNLKNIRLYYGNPNLAFEQADLQNCTSGKKQTCSIDIDLKKYDGQEISYFFEITDIAGNVASSKQTKMKVDETPPVINSLSYNVSGKYVSFFINVTEANFYRIEYTDSFDGRTKVLCSVLTKGICSKRLAFLSGTHNLDIQAEDKAGNSVAQNMGFTIK